MGSAEVGGEGNGQTNDYSKQGHRLGLSFQVSVRAVAKKARGKAEEAPLQPESGQVKKP